MKPSSRPPSPRGPGARPQVSIERLPARHPAGEPRESMSCKSCRKRKIKCNRKRPACEACQVFQCPCIYDAVPKKRGPKTDVLEALLKRVDGLEARLRDRPLDSDQAASLPRHAAPDAPESPGTVEPSTLVDTYFSRFHGKPFYILDESALRQRIHRSQVPVHLYHALCAVAARHVPLHQGRQAAARLSCEYAASARRGLDTDEPSMEALQTLLLLVLAYVAAGQGKKAHMLTTSAVGMATALELHREVVDSQAHVTPGQRELRRRLFWSCYLLDRSLACGSRRPSLIRDESIALRLPSSCTGPAEPPVDGDFFQPDSNPPCRQGTGQAMLIDIARILGVTNRYLAAGGVKGDSHFPWHSLSTLSKIRHQLDFWASGASDVFPTDIEPLLRHPEATVLVLSKLIYHLIHCLVFRPFLPIHLAELSDQSWQVDATNTCFLHANAIAELVARAQQAGTVEWPSLVGYCIYTAATVHIHGAHYTSPTAGSEMGVFGASADFLSAEMRQLRDLEHAWAMVDDHCETLQAMYSAHGELVKALGGSPMRHAPIFHLDDFFDRYVNTRGRPLRFDPAHLSLWSTVDEFVAASSAGLEPGASPGGEPSIPKRGNTASSSDREAPESRARPSETPREQALQQAASCSGLLRSFAEDAASHYFVNHPLSKTADDHLSVSPLSYSTLTVAPGGDASRTGFGAYIYEAASKSSDGGYAAANDHGNSYDSAFAPGPSGAYWRGDDAEQDGRTSLLSPEAANISIGSKALTETAHGDGHEQFLSLLGQLADSGSRTELDAFLTPGGSGSA